MAYTIQLFMNFNVSATKKIPNNWLKPTETKTRTESLEKRKYNPDISYDLDGDGVIGNTDLLISRRFDMGNKGKLTNQERELAFQALRNGLAEKFVWGCETSGSNRSFRILQKRGIAILDDDFTKISETYHRINRSENKTLSELKALRKLRNREEAETSADNLNTKFFKRLPIENFIDPETHVKTPRFKTFTEKKQFVYMEHRKRAGLMSPSMVNTRNTLKSYSTNQVQHRKRTKFIDAEGNDDSFGLNYSKRTFDHSLRGKTVNSIKQVRIEQDREYNDRVFGKHVLGIHKPELPQFQHNLHLIPSQESKSIDESKSLSPHNFKKFPEKNFAITDKPTQIVHETSPIDYKYHMKRELSNSMIIQCTKSLTPVKTTSYKARKKPLLYSPRFNLTRNLFPKLPRDGRLRTRGFKKTQI